MKVRLSVSHFVRQSFRPWTRSTYSPLLYFGYPTRHPKKAHVSCLPVLETVLQKRDIPSARQVNSSCTLKAWDWPVPVTPWKIFRGENAASRQACIKTGLTLATLQTGNLASEGNVYRSFWSRGIRWVAALRHYSLWSVPMQDGMSAFLRRRQQRQQLQHPLFLHDAGKS